MGKRGAASLFNTIAPVYGLFFNRQRSSFARVIRRAGRHLDLAPYDTVLDVGCGPGAFCSVLNDKGLRVTGIDPAAKMLDTARRRPENKGVRFIQANVLERLPFPDKSFDISFASYVAHGLKKEERRRMYAEMGRLTKHRVIIHDFNKNRAWLITFAEWLERGDYFRFINAAEDEMRNCVSGINECFSEVRVIGVDTHASWYICTPK